MNVDPRKIEIESLHRPRRMWPFTLWASPAQAQSTLTGVYIYKKKQAILIRSEDLQKPKRPVETTTTTTTKKKKKELDTHTQRPIPLFL